MTKMTTTGSTDQMTHSKSDTSAGLPDNSAQLEPTSKSSSRNSETESPTAPEATPASFGGDSAEGDSTESEAGETEILEPFPSDYDEHDVEPPTVNLRRRVAQKGRSKNTRSIKARRSRSSTQLSPSEISKIFELSAKGLGEQEIARTIDRSPKTVQKHLALFLPWFKGLNKVKEFNEVKTDLLSAAEYTFLKSAVSPVKLARASTRDLMYAFTQTHQANRLEKGLSTSNSSEARFTKIVLIKDGTLTPLK